MRKTGGAAFGPPRTPQSAQLHQFMSAEERTAMERALRAHANLDLGRELHREVLRLLRGR